jgi:indole-3-glycerol phosphate synthase
MPTTLQDIAERTRETVEAARVARPQAELESAVDACTSPRDFFGAVTGRSQEDGVRVIAEFKRCSPSGGAIRPGADPADIARRYENAGAAAISCLTDGPYFDGALADLAAIRDAVALPMLRKDFMIDPYQVWEARAAGADAILLIAELLADDQLDALATLADALGLTSVIEVHDRENLLRVKPHLHGRRLLGVNNRNLRTMTTDLAHVEAMLDDLADHMDILVCESGIGTRNDIERLGRVGIHRFLIGESLLRAEDPGRALQSLLTTAG